MIYRKKRTVFKSVITQFGTLQALLSVWRLPENSNDRSTNRELGAIWPQYDVFLAISLKLPRFTACFARNIPNIRNEILSRERMSLRYYSE